MKALTRFSVGAQIFDAGDEVNLTDTETAYLLSRGLIAEGEGKPKKEPEETPGAIPLDITEKAPKKEKKKIERPGD
jgi:hypothetical protein